MRKNQINTNLLLITACMMLYGISDVIFYKREGYLVYLFGIVFSIFIAKNYSQDKQFIGQALLEQALLEQDIQR